MQHVQDILLFVIYILAELTTYITPLMFKGEFGFMAFIQRPSIINNNEQTVNADLKL